MPNTTSSKSTVLRATTTGVVCSHYTNLGIYKEPKESRKLGDCYPKKNVGSVESNKLNGENSLLVSKMEKLELHLHFTKMSLTHSRVQPLLVSKWLTLVKLSCLSCLFLVKL